MNGAVNDLALSRRPALRRRRLHHRSAPSRTAAWHAQRHDRRARRVHGRRRHGEPQLGRQRGRRRAHPVGVDQFDITPDGTPAGRHRQLHLADGLPRDQVASSCSARRGRCRRRLADPAVRAGLLLVGLDYYMRDVQISPDGAYFAVVSSGGYNTGTLCDTVTRWDSADRGDDVQPRWADYTGGDSLFSVEVTGAAIYAGGHQRWMNNPSRPRLAGAGRGPAAGHLGARPAHRRAPGLEPGPQPARRRRRGDARHRRRGLYIGMDTEYIGNFAVLAPRPGGVPPRRRRRPRTRSSRRPCRRTFERRRRAATGGGRRQRPARCCTASTPVAPSSTRSTAARCGPATARTARSARPAATRPAGTGCPTVDGTVPPTTPPRSSTPSGWDPSDDPEMQWDFPVPAGTASTSGCTSPTGHRHGEPGQRVFDVRIDGRRCSTTTTSSPTSATTSAR